MSDRPTNDTPVHLASDEEEAASYCGVDADLELGMRCTDNRREVTCIGCLVDLRADSGRIAEWCSKRISEIEAQHGAPEAAP